MRGLCGLRQRYCKDPNLLQFYAERLLQRGWAGTTDDLEKAYLASHVGWYQAAQERGRKIGAMNFEASQGRPPGGPKRRSELASKAKADGEKTTVAPATGGVKGNHDGTGQRRQPRLGTKAGLSSTAACTLCS